ncbi:MAG: mechanosensitive ion channel [Deltaproteobacteria bacterium]|nr:mechanosensitive ion channel [Deltaproteobacteria bacterium]
MYILDLMGGLRDVDQLAHLLVVIISAVAMGLVISVLLFRFLAHWSRRSDDIFSEAVVKYLKRPSKFLFPVLCLMLFAPALCIPDDLAGAFRHFLGIAFIATLTWMAIRTVAVIREIILSRFDVDQKDNLAARKIYTQFRVIERVIIVIILVIGVSSLLMTFEKIRQLGVSIMASAGVIGIIVGFAAQRSISTLFAGIQIAITQPIRLDDVVIVENEWGWIEEITLTYVVVRVWDLRRLVVPITYFIERPFQNWTRVSADILGTVFLYMDYSVPVRVIREELQKIVKGSDLWDGKVCGVQVTDATQQTVEVRALVSAADSSKAWDLRCLVREKLLEFLQNKYPAGLPKTRVEMEKSILGKDSAQGVIA